MQLHSYSAIRTYLFRVDINKKFFNVNILHNNICNHFNVVVAEKI